VELLYLEAIDGPHRIGIRFITRMPEELSTPSRVSGGSIAVD
jgi:hypothetical protein